jgi:hypothetical protein
MKVQPCLAVTFLLLSPALSPFGEAAQSSTNAGPHTPGRTVASAKCHMLLAQFQGKDEDFFAQKTDEDLADIDDSIRACATDSYAQLSRSDLAAAVLAGAMVARQMQSRADAVAYAALQEQYANLLAKSAPKPPNSHKVTVLVISPLPNGLTRTLSIGGHENTCVAVESMQLECKVNVSNPGFVIPTYLVAMLATPKPLPMFEHSFLMGCNPKLSANCFPLVAGEYSAEYVGTDGISIAGIVPEDRPNDPPHHGTFVIYHQGEMP